MSDVTPTYKVPLRRLAMMYTHGRFTRTTIATLGAKQPPACESPGSPRRCAPRDDGAHRHREAPRSGDVAIKGAVGHPQGEIFEARAHCNACEKAAARPSEKVPVQFENPPALDALNDPPHP